MFFDQNYNSIVDQVIVFPDFAFAGLPRAEPLTEVDIINANNTNTISIGGSIQD